QIIPRGHTATPCTLAQQRQESSEIGTPQDTVLRAPWRFEVSKTSADISALGFPYCGGRQCARSAIFQPHMALQPHQHSFLALDPHGFNCAAYSEWGSPSQPRVVICVHGLTRNCRDFDSLAAVLAGHFRVVCMDVVGRGASDWLEHKEDYGFGQYLSDAA